MSSGQISLVEIEEIYSIFKSKDWKIDKINKFSLYNRFLNTYKLLDEMERKLFLELSKEFLLVNLNDYQECLCNVLSNMISNIYKNSFNDSNIYVMPLISKKNSKKIKSSTFMVYLFMSTQLLYFDTLVKKNFMLIDNYDNLDRKKNAIIQGSKPLILVDDFIGSGTQAIEAIKDVESMGFIRERLFVVAPYIHETGLNTFRKNNVNCAYSSIIYKSFSSNSKRKDKYKVMEGIERKINVDNGYNMGYLQSEALISLVRTPNNTLPIFWYSGSRKKKSLAPFPRRI